MNKKKLYIGTIKKCLDSYSLEIYGEERYFGSNNTNNHIRGNHEIFAKTEKTNAVLLKGRHNQYIDVDNIKGIKDLIFFKLGKSHKIMKIKPTCNDELYVDENTVKPYTEEEKIKTRH